MRTAVLSITDGGSLIGEKISSAIDNAEHFDCRGRLNEIVREQWQVCDRLVFIMATGIVVRLIAPLLVDKRSDPGVVALDEKGRFVISLLSGHLGGGNELAIRVAKITGGEPVITTASDLLGHTALDLWAESYNLAADDAGKFASVSARLVNRGSIKVYSNCGLPELPHDIQPVSSPGKADIIITIKSDIVFQGLSLHPRMVVAGIGCNRGTSEEEIGKALRDTCRIKGISPMSIRALASIDIKKEEPGLAGLASKLTLPLLFFSKDELNEVENVALSAAVMNATGAKGVAEPSAILGAGGGGLVVKKVKWKNVTVAMAVDALPWWKQKDAFSPASHDNGSS